MSKISKFIYLKYSSAPTIQPGKLGLNFASYPGIDKVRQRAQLVLISIEKLGLNCRK